MESLIFDVDGTLWDAVALVAEGWNDGLQSMGFAPHCTEQSIRPLFGKTMTEIAQVVVPGVPQEQAMEVMDRCMDGEMARLRRDPCHIFYPGVKETLTELHKTHRLFIVSNCQQGYIELLMEKGGLGGLISDFDCFGNTACRRGRRCACCVSAAMSATRSTSATRRATWKRPSRRACRSCGRPTASASPRTGISASIILPICCASETQIVPCKIRMSTMHTARTASAPSHTARRRLTGMRPGVLLGGSRCAWRSPCTTGL